MQISNAASQAHLSLCDKTPLPYVQCFDGRIDNKHHHLIEIEIAARQISEDFMEFASMDSILKEVFDQYQHQYLNDFPEFRGNTSIEHMGALFPIFWLRLFC